MSRRFINCSACKGCHTGRGGQFCQFLSPKAGTGVAAMASKDPSVPDRDSEEYLTYLTDQITAEEVGEMVISSDSIIKEDNNV